MNFKTEADKIHDMVEEVYESYIFVGKGKGTKQGCIAIHGSDVDLISHLSKAFRDVRSGVIEKNGGNEKLADELMKAVYLTPEQLRKELLERMHEMLAEVFEPSEDEEEEDDDADEEPCDCDDDSCEDCDDAEEKAHEKALEALRKAMRDCGDSDLTFDVSGHVRRGKPRG